jgi:GTP cyclohydrolase I
MSEILEQIYGCDWRQDENLKETPQRYARMMTELTKGLCTPEFKFTGFQKETYQDIVSVKDIPFFSLCAHHLVPFFGKVSIAYKPKDKVVGLSKLPRLVQHLAAKPQIQERLSTEIVDTLMKELDPEGVIVIINARHLCMEMRGVKSVGNVTVTSSARGIFIDDMNMRQEVLQILGVNQTHV